MIFDDDIILENDLVRIEPMKESHREELGKLASDPAIWEHNTRPAFTTEAWEEYFNRALEGRASKTRYPFVITDLRTGKLAGSTSYGNLSIHDHRVEIGWTWIDKSYWGSGLNATCKFLLLSFAFEKMNMKRVELKTDVQNLRSRKAILKLGATEEGILRSHMTTARGKRRDTIYFSILADEWPEIRLQLLPSGTRP